MHLRSREASTQFFLRVGSLRGAECYFLPFFDFLAGAFLAFFPAALDFWVVLPTFDFLAGACFFAVSDFCGAVALFCSAGRCSCACAGAPTHVAIDANPIRVAASILFMSCLSRIEGVDA